MAYEPLHHKYRPQTFGDLVGQEAIANTLINAIEQEKIATAYLFTGPRGTGKTSSARILAKSLNCLASPQPTATPCGKCDVCQAIAAGIALDVIEIDAASNTGVDNIREIIERAKFAPVQARYKVYVIDECHMLSTAAFNALLKTLEEPPPQVVFVLATTDPQRVLSTIISRCQRFDYRRIPLGEMIRHLEYIAATEKIAIAKPAITLVAQIANGGLRDAESLLDQLSLFPETITVDRVWDLVGAVPEQDLLGLLSAIRSKNIEHILEKCRTLLDRGKEPLVVLQNLASFYLNLLIAKTSPQRNDLVAVTETCWQELQTEAAHWQIADILQGQQKLKEAEVQLKNTTQPRLWLEVTLLGLISQSYATQEVLQETAARPHVAERQGEQRDRGTRETRETSGATPMSFTHPGNPHTRASAHQERGTREKLVSQTQNSSSSKLTEGQTVVPIAHSSSVAQPQQPEKKTVESISNESITHAAKISQPQPSQAANSQAVTPISETETKETSVSAIPNSDSDRDNNQDTIWQKAIALVQPPTTQSLLSQKCHLISIKDSMVIIGVVSPPLIKLIQAKIANIETAFTQACQRKIKVTLEVAKKTSQPTTNNDSPTPIKPQSNGSSPFPKPETATIQAPEKIPVANIQPPPPINPPPPPPAKPLIHQEKVRSPVEKQESALPVATADSPAITNTEKPIAHEQANIPNQDIITSSPAADDFQKLVELVAKSFDGEVISLGNGEENSSSESEETEIAHELNSQANQEQLATPIRNRPDLTAYEDEEDVPF